MDGFFVIAGGTAVAGTGGRGDTTAAGVGGATRSGRLNVVLAPVSGDDTLPDRDVRLISRASA